MNDSPKNDPETMRSDIDDTRRRMDNTMDALGDRLQPRHLLDELLGFLRGNSNDGESRLTAMREKLTTSCDTAMHSVVDTVKKNPMPALVIGAGVAWMIYSSRRERSGEFDYADYSAEDASYRYDPDMHYDRPLEYPSSASSESQWSEEGSSKIGEMKERFSEKASAATGQIKEKLSHAGDIAREKMETAREKMNELRGRAGETTARVRESTRDAYSRSRQRIATTAEQHPLEVGLVALAAGLMAGLAMRTPTAVNRKLGPAADRLRERTREAGSEMFEKGKRVAQAATSAVKEEAEAQGLTPERLREKAGAVADRAREAGRETAEREGIKPGSPGGMNPSYPGGSDPSVARPAV